MKAITLNSFLSVLDFTSNLPISVNSAVNKEKTHSWSEGLETESDDLAGYGVYITNKILQSLVGSTANELIKVERNLAWFEDNSRIGGDAVDLRRKWILHSEYLAGMYRSLFVLIKKRQKEMLTADGKQIHDVSKAESSSDGFSDWSPQEWVPFPYNEASVRAKAKLAKQKPADIEERIKYDKLIFERISQRFGDVQVVAEIQDTLYYKYAQKILAVASDYYERCISKKGEHYKHGRDSLSKDADMRAQYLEIACEGIYKEIKNAYDEIAPNSVH